MIIFYNSWRKKKKKDKIKCPVDYVVKCFYVIKGPSIYRLFRFYLIAYLPWTSINWKQESGSSWSFGKNWGTMSSFAPTHPYFNWKALVFNWLFPFPLYYPLYPIWITFVMTEENPKKSSQFGTFETEKMPKPLINRVPRELGSILMRFTK